LVGVVRMQSLSHVKITPTMTCIIKGFQKVLSIPLVLEIDAL
jgi:hypothetical protein